MKLSTFVWQPGAGWPAGALPETDSPDTLVVALGDASLAEEPGPIHELAAAYPSSRVVGCSTSGQIAGTSLSDGTLVVAVARFERSRLRAASAPVSCPADSRAAGHALAEQLDDPSLCAVGRRETCESRRTETCDLGGDVIFERAGSRFISRLPLPSPCPRQESNLRHQV